MNTELKDKLETIVTTGKATKKEIKLLAEEVKKYYSTLEKNLQYQKEYTEKNKAVRREYMRNYMRGYHKRKKQDKND